MFFPRSPLFDEAGAVGSDGGGASFDAVFDSAMSAPDPAPSADPVSAVGSSTPDTSASLTSGEGAAPSPAAPPTPEATPAPVTPEAAQPEDPEAEDQELETAQQTEAPNILDLKTSRGKRIYGGYKAYKAFTESLGFEPSVEQIRQHFQAHSDQLAMESEFLSGDPNAIANFASHWYNRSPQAFQQMVSQLPDQLAQGDAATYQAMAVPVIQRYINAMYQQAAQEQNPDQKAAMLYAARMNDWNVFGRFRKDNEITAPQQAPADPQFAAQQQYVQQGLQQITAWQQQQQVAVAQQWTQGLYQNVNSELGKQVDTALAPLKAALAPRVYAATVRDFTEAVKQHLSQDADGQRIFELNASQAQRRMSSEDYPSLTGIFMSRASRAVRALAPGFLKEAGIAAQAQSAQRHQALAASAAAGNAASATGGPASRSIAPASERQYSSKSEKMDAMMDELLGSGKR